MSQISKFDFDEGVLVKGKGLEGITFILNYVDNVYFGQRQFPEPVLIYRGVTGYYPRKENGTIVQVSQSQGMGLLNEGNALRGRMQSFAWADAKLCVDGCKALRLRWAKLTRKSSVLFWIREKGGTSHHKVHYSPPRK